MYVGCFLQTRFLKILNMSIDLKTRPSISSKTCDRAFDTFSRAFETHSRAFEGLRENRKLDQVFEKFRCVFLL